MFDKSCQLKNVGLLFFLILKDFDDFSVLKKFENSFRISHMEPEINLRSVSCKLDEVIEIMIHHMKRSFKKCEFLDFDIRAQWDATFFKSIFSDELVTGQQLTGNGTSSHFAFFIGIDHRKVFDIGSQKKLFKGIILEHCEKELHPVVNVKVFCYFWTQDIAQNCTVVHIL